MMKPLVALILCSLLLSFSCSIKKREPFRFYPTLNDTSVIKKEMVNQRVIEYSYFSLSDITKGANDSLEIRIWPRYAFNRFKNCFVFKINFGEIQGLHYNSFTLPVTDADGLINTWKDTFGLGENIFIVKHIAPECGWQKFYDSLSFFKLTELPTQTEIKNFKRNVMLDGYGYDFEIATPNSYRFLVYQNPNNCIYYDECKLITEFIALLQRQFKESFRWILP